MTSTIYALLVGIDRYQSPNIRPLSGCVNDITAVEQFLKERVAGGRHRLDPLVLLNQQATYQAIIDGFRAHLCKAGPGDVALFYYSGHGSQEQAPPEFWHLEPDKLDETLVCYDSRTPGHYDLADKELGKLIAEVAARDPHVVVILDCCHSGTATRDEAVSQATIRRAATDARARPLDSFKVFTMQEVKALSDAGGATEGGSRWITLPRGKHILMAACHDYETAKELPIDGRRRGIFSYYLLDTLRQSGRNLTYRDLFKRVEALVKNGVLNQTPQIEAGAGSDLKQPFLGGAIDRSEYFTLSYGDERGWVIDGGAVHGLPPPADDDTTMLAIFPRDGAVEDLRWLDRALGEVRVVEILPQLSAVEVTPAGGRQLDQQQTYKAVVTSMPVRRLGVLIEGDAGEVARLTAAIETTGPRRQPSLYLRPVADAGGARLRVLARDNAYGITRPAEERRLTADIDGYGDPQARKLVARLEHIARWTTIAELENPGSRLAGAVRLELHRVTGAPKVRSPNAEQTEPFPDEAEIRLEYRYKHKQWQPPAYKLKLVNTGDEELYCALAYLSQEFAIDTSSWFPGGMQRLGPGQEVWATQGRQIPSEVPDELWWQGITEYRDTYKLIVSTEQFDATLLEQEDLDFALAPRSVRGSRANTLNQLLDKARTRKPNLAAQRDTYADWATSQVGLTVVRPLDTRPVPEPGQPPADLGTGVTLEPHQGLRGRARLTTLPQASRSLGGHVQPAIFRDNPSATYLHQFTAGRGSDPGLSALELLDVADHAAVTPDAPLIVHIAGAGTHDADALSGEQLIPYASDGEFFLPLGAATRTAEGYRVELRHLPPPIKPQNLDDPAAGDRSLTGSIHIFFQVTYFSTVAGLCELAEVLK